MYILVFDWHKGPQVVVWRERERELVGYANADGNMAEDQHVMSGYVFVVDGVAVSWSIKQQEIVLLSMTESEYIVVTHVVKEALWLHMLISQVFRLFHPDTATMLFSDNKSVITLSKDHQYHTHT